MLMHDVLSLVVAALTFGSVYALLALSINIIYSASNIVNFAQGELMMLGAMFGVAFFIPEKIPYIAALALVILCVALVGAGENFLIVQPLRKKNARIISAIIGTMGASIIMRIAASLKWGRIEKYAPPPLGSHPLKLLGTTVAPQSLLVVAIVIVVLAVLWFVYKKTMLGLAVRATAFNPSGAKLMGINVGAVITVAFLIGAGLAGLAGLILSPLSYASPWLGMNYAIRGFTATILGGLGSWPGAVLGGLILGLVEVFANAYISSNWGNAISLILLILVLYIRPAGLFGTTQFEEVEVLS